MTTFNGFEPANTTPVPDTLFDVLLSKLSGAELKVMLYIIRRTLGFKKTTDTISFTQFEKGIITSEGKILDEGTGLSRETISKALQTLEEKGCIKSDKGYTPQKDKDTTLYSIRFNGDEGVVGKSDHVGSRKNGLPVVGKTDYGSRIIPEGVVGKSDLQETVLQDTVKQETVLQEREVAHATAPAESPSQENDLEKTEKRKAILPQNHNMGTQPPLPRKPPTNPVPKRPKQQGLMDELPSSPASKPVEPHADMTWGTRKCLQWFDYWRGGVLIAKYKLQQAASCAKGLAEQFDEATVIQIHSDMAEDQYYIERGGPDICDVANNIHKYLNKKKPKKEPSNEHRVSSFGTPGYNFADEFYPSEAEKKAYYAAHPQGVKS